MVSGLNISPLNNLQKMFLCEGYQQHSQDSLQTTAINELTNKYPDHFDDILLTRAFLGKYLHRKMQNKSFQTIHSRDILFMVNKDT